MKSARAGTIELVFRLTNQVRPTRASVQTRVGAGTPDQLYRTVFASVQKRRTIAVPVRPFIHARAVLARIVSVTLIDVDLTMHALDSVLTLAHVASNLVDARAPPARTTLTLVDVDLAIVAHDARHTHAFVPFCG